MSKTLLRISIPQPCNENWETMLPYEKGRHCLSCQKTVVDFSKMADSEIIHYFQEYKGATCGRFSETQLNRPVTEPFISKPSNRWAWMFSAMLLPFAGSSQDTQPKANIEISTPSVPEPKLVAKRKSKSCDSSVEADSKEKSIFFGDETFLAGDVNVGTVKSFASGMTNLIEEPKMELKDVFTLAYQQLYFLYLNVLAFLKSNI